MMIRIQATRRETEIILWYRYPVTEATMEEAIEDGRSAYYTSPYRQDPSYHDWRIEMCEYDLGEEGDPINIRIVRSNPI